MNGSEMGHVPHSVDVLCDNAEACRERDVKAIFDCCESTIVYQWFGQVLDPQEHFLWRERHQMQSQIV